MMPLELEYMLKGEKIKCSILAPKWTHQDTFMIMDDSVFTELVGGRKSRADDT